jgi:hypothetical protein
MMKKGFGEVGIIPRLREKNTAWQPKFRRIAARLTQAALPVGGAFRFPL